METLNDALGIGLESPGWKELKSPGDKTDKNALDWFKSKKPEVEYITTDLGVGLEIQFGNNYQFNEDIKRFTGAFLAGKVQVGISVVASDTLAKHKADREAFFSEGDYLFCREDLISG